MIKYLSRQFSTAIGIVILITACDTDKNHYTGEENIPLSISVSPANFVSPSGAVTRSTDNGNQTTFDKDDRIGIIVISQTGNILADNLPYRYDGSAWTFDRILGENEGKSPYYYDNTVGSVSYLVYFPYRPEANGLSTATALKLQFPPLPDQRDEAAYRNSDLMLWESGSGIPQKSLNIRLEHAYSLISLSPSVQLRMPDGTVTKNAISVGNVSLTIAGETRYARPVTDGSWRYIVQAGTKIVPRWLYTYRNAVYQGTLPAITTVANTRYTLRSAVDIPDYGWDKAKAGDFYCTDAENKTFLLPAESLSFPASATVVGIVFYVGEQASVDDLLLKKAHPTCTHGLVVSLGMDFDDWLYSSLPVDINTTWINAEGNPYKGEVNLAEDKKMCGYSNTLALHDYNEGLYGSTATGDDWRLKVRPCLRVREYETRHPSPAGSSGWYVPSYKELEFIYAEKDLLNVQLSKITGLQTLEGQHWSITEDGFLYAYIIDFTNGSKGVIAKYMPPGRNIRYILAV